MSRFIQLHLLTSYPPSNLNRDDLGRPKTAIMGGKTRLRISSQSLKRAWRTSEVFENTLNNHIGTRTKAKGIEIYEKLIEKGVSKKLAFDSAKSIADVFGKLKKLSAAEKKKLDGMEENERKKKERSELEIEQLSHISPEEDKAIDALIDQIVSSESKPEKEDFAKAMMLGADAIAVSNSALQAIGCLGMRACSSNNCPVGIATQKESFRQRIIIDSSAKQLT